MLAGRTVVLGVSGGIAAYKAAEIVRWLRKEEAAVVVVMTAAAKQFISPLTLATLSGNPVLDDLWAPSAPLTFGRPRSRTSPVEHIEVADAADLVLLAPATANLLAKAAHGFADDMVTTVLLATRAPVVVCPAMNVQMWEHPATQQNLATLKARGWHSVEPESGDLACGWEGRGRLASLEAIQRTVHRVLAGSAAGVAGAAAAAAAARPATAAAAAGPLSGRTVVVTAGPTREPIDPVRYLSNHSSGRMGYALAEAARDAGATVVLISGPVALAPPDGVRVVRIGTARELQRALAKEVAKADALVMAAAVADYRPARVAAQKIKRGAGPGTLELVANPDLLRELERPAGLKVVGFALETERELEAARAKLRAKRCDLLVLNNPTRAGSEFGGETNEIAILDAQGGVERLPVLAKRVAADRVVARLAALFVKRAAGGRRGRK